MHILIIGAAGMVGRKLADRLAKDGHLGGKEITKATLHDVVEPSAPAGAKFSSTVLASDFSLPGEAAKLVAGRPDVIFHLAAIVSGEAEQNFDLGYRINLHGTMELFAAIRANGDGYRPRVVFTSSIAVYGAPFPDAIGDEFFTTPLTSYGTQKAIGELLLSDYSRATRPFCRFPKAFGIGMPARARRWAFWFMLRRWISTSSARAATLPCPAFQ